VYRSSTTTRLLSDLCRLAFKPNNHREISPITPYPFNFVHVRQEGAPS
jgi:hypothetical protein